MDFIEKSIEVILSNQRPGGAYLASPDFPPYQYGWFRDGVYTAYAMDLYGCHQSAEKFFDWSAGIIERYSQRIVAAAQDPERALENIQEATFHCRFFPNGDEIISGWSNHQLDGLGMWLWGIIRHCKIRGWNAVPGKWQRAVILIVDYLKVLWPYPCADCWEEHDGQIHTYTLAALIGGFKAIQEFGAAADLNPVIDKIEDYLNSFCVAPSGYYQKSTSQASIDANLLGLVFPFQVTSADDPRFLRTLAMIENELKLPGGGLRRYPDDSYYGGGEWILLAAWLGIVYLFLNQVEESAAIRSWIESQFNEDGFLPEQVTGNVVDQGALQAWTKKWGPPAIPLIWSHAKYLILCHNLKQVM